MLVSYHINLVKLKILRLSKIIGMIYNLEWREYYIVTVLVVVDFTCASNLEGFQLPPLYNMVTDKLNYEVASAIG